MLERLSARLGPEQVLQGRLFGLIGGHSVTTGDYSGGASQVSLPHIIGDMEVYSPQTAWEVIRDNTEVFVLVGCDPWKNNRIEYTVADHQMYSRWEAIRDAGVKFVSINPQRTTTDEAMRAEWVKIIPNTDTALFLAMAYHVYTTGKYDKAYLDKYTVGFDKFAPSLADKTPEWAEGITGISAHRIRALARDAIPAQVRPRYGLVVSRANLRTFPTTERVFRKVSP